MNGRTLRRAVLPAAVIAVVAVGVGLASRDLDPSLPIDRLPGPAALESIRAAAERVDRVLAERWRSLDVAPAADAAELTVLRRLTLALAGTVPSLEEIRRFEADARPDRLDRFTAALLADRRSAEHVAARLASAFLGDGDGQFIVFRRDRFTAWLADQIHAGRPFDAVVREMVAARGLWTDTPAVNFVTQAVVADRIDAEALAGRVSRSLLGQRIDCAQCHDHPFAPTTRSQFQRLAACFAPVTLSPLGVEDDSARVHRMEPMGMMAGTGGTGTGAVVPPGVPFGDAWLPEHGTSRERVAAWVVHPDNRRFPRALANRCFALVVGRPWHAPVDDLPDPPAEGTSDVLDLLAADFTSHGRDLRRLLAVIATTRVLRLDSAHPALATPAGCDLVADAWAAFPLTALGPDQIIGGMVQATSLRTIDRDSHLATRFIGFIRELEFIREYGGPADDRSFALPGTIPQALARMNGRFAREMVEANAFTAMGRIAGMAADDDTRLETAFLVALTRRPTSAEREALRPLLASAPTRGAGLEDVCWTLFNSPEFSWNH
jgi:hypothetical protein